MKRYLKKGDRAYTTGAFVIWDGEKFILDSFDDDIHFEGELVDFAYAPYVELNEDV